MNFEGYSAATVTLQHDMLPLSQDKQPFEALDDVDNVPACSDSRNSTTKHEYTREVLIHKPIIDEEISKEAMLFEILKETLQLYNNYCNKMKFEPDTLTSIKMKARY
ncbi:hypothetical protein PIB30_083076 [Stylosanthes scabra]|uniref:Uncharacterized protein n=1 Tax=Stylosanthes scabra TaxID=79078 RepID=A0ABU6SSE0_9FABA|nr:hypothetical protein [Stylosanthes scabra]